jgi:lipopolysaccharide heptosyltransferase II
MSTPAIRALKESAAGRKITLLTSPAGAEAARLVPETDGVLVYDAPWMKATAIRANSRPDLMMVDRLRAACFDGAVIFTVYSQSPLPAALLCYLAEIPLRLAYCRENPYQLLTDWGRETEPETHLRHEVRRQLDLVATVGARTDNERLSIRVPEAAMAAADELLAAHHDGKRPWVVIHPGATAASRRYPPEHFATVARRLVRELGCEVFFTGTESEGELIEDIRAWMGEPSQSFAGALDIPEFAALLVRAPLLVSNNTGAVHLAAAVGTPVVDLYALTNPQHTPWQVPHRVLFADVPCKYCYKSVCPEGHHHCLRLVTPDTVIRAIKELLDETVDRRALERMTLVHPGH